jgi:hypothetical protein
MGQRYIGNPRRDTGNLSGASTIFLRFSRSISCTSISAAPESLPGKLAGPLSVVLANIAAAAAAAAAAAVLLNHRAAKKRQLHVSPPSGASTALRQRENGNYQQEEEEGEEEEGREEIRNTFIAMSPRC